jgi:Protein of unknown function (DUF1569)
LAGYKRMVSYDGLPGNQKNNSTHNVFNIGMNSIFNQPEFKEIRSRIENLKPDAQKQWGKMSVAQMMAHCSAGIENILGKTPFVDESNFILRILVKPIVLRAVAKGNLGKNQKTYSPLVITDDRDFETEKKRLLLNLNELYAAGNESELGKHPLFGTFSNDNWGALQYAHFNHHLTQFSG